MVNDNYSLRIANTSLAVKPRVMLVVVASVAFWSLWLFWNILGFDAFRSDVHAYWQNSLSWQEPYDVFHLPLYPWLIALARTITFNLLPPILLMQIVVFAAYLVSALLVYGLLRRGDLDERLAVFGSLLFSMWPFVGIVYGVYPVSDTLAVMLVLAGVYAHQREEVAGLLLGLALVTHKITWPFVGLLTLARLIQSRSNPRKALLLYLPFLLAPITLLWFAGSLYYHYVGWLFASTLNQEAASRSQWFILDGVFSNLSHGTSGLLKIAVLIGVAVVAVVAMALFARSSSLIKYDGMALAGGALLLCLLLSALNIWAAVRFSKLLALPLLWGLYERNPKLLRSKLLWSLALLGTLLSQFVYAWYTAEVFF